MDISLEYDRLYRRYADGDLTRRGFLRSVGVLAAAGGVLGTALDGFMTPAEAAQAVRFDSWGGAAQASYMKLIFDPISRNTGLTVNQGQFGSEVEFLARLGAEGLKDYNFFTAGNPSTCLLFVDRGYVEELDEAKIPRLKDIIPRAVDAYRKLLPSGKLAAVPYFTTGVAIAYNTEKVSQADVEKEGFRILLDPKLNQKIAAEDQWQRRICYAALQTGQDINDIKDMDLVWNTIIEGKKNSFKYWRTSSEQIQLVSSGEAWVCEAWLAPIVQMKKSGLPIGVYPSNGTYVNFASFVVLKGSPMDTAYEVIDMLLRPEVQIAQAEASGNATMLDPTHYAIPESVKNLVGFDPTGTLAGFRALDAVYWNKNAAEWQRQYRRVVARN